MQKKSKNALGIDPLKGNCFERQKHNNGFNVGVVYFANTNIK